MSTNATPRLFLSPPHMSGHEQGFITEAFATNYIAPLGPMVDAFEKEFAAFIGLPYAAAFSSGTAAIHLALQGMGAGSGDCVIASSFTFIGSVGPIMYQGATPVFVDCDEATWCMSPVLLEEAFAWAKKNNKRVKAVLPTDLYGQSCDVDALLAICNAQNVPLIVDSAESLGATYKNRHAGTGAKAAAFSFNGNKIITTGGGGMLASDDKILIDKVRFLSQQAREPGAHYEHKEVGYNYRMSSIAAAIGRGQMKVLPDRVKRRRAIRVRYEELLGNIAGLSFMPEASHGSSNAWLTVLQIDEKIFGASPEQVRQALEKHNIESRPAWKPMHMQPVFKDAPMIGGKISEGIFARGLCIPSGSAMSDADVERVASFIVSLKR